MYLSSTEIYDMTGLYNIDVIDSYLVEFCGKGYIKKVNAGLPGNYCLSFASREVIDFIELEQLILDKLL